jgi:hypothetical protein
MLRYVIRRAHTGCLKRYLGGGPQSEFKLDLSLTLGLQSDWLIFKNFPNLANELA